MVQRIYISKGHEKAVEDVVFLGTPAFIEATQTNGRLQPWLEGVPGEPSTGTKKLVHQLLHHLTIVSHVWCGPLEAISPNSAYIHLFFLLLLPHPCEASLLAAAAWLTAPSPEPPAEPKKQDKEPSKGPELPLLQCSKEEGSLDQPALPLAPLLHAVLQPSHFLSELLFTLLHALVCIHIHVVSHQPWPLGNAEHR